MSGEVEYYVGMRVLAQGRQGTITRVLPSGYDVDFGGGVIGKNLPASSLTPYENLSIAKQVGGPPPVYTSVGAPYPGGNSSSQPMQYQYPISQAGYQPQQQSLSNNQGYAVGVSSTPVVHAINATPVTVTATPTYLIPPNVGAQRGNKLPGFEHSPDIGHPFTPLLDCSGACMMSCCCPCIVGGQVAEKIGMGSYAVVCGSYIAACIFFLIISIIVRGLWFFLLLWIGWSLFVCSARSKVRRMWQMGGDHCDDCCVSFCCLGCTLGQVARHVFGYRHGDTPPCGSDGTPLWQRYPSAQNTTVPTPNVLNVQPQTQQQYESNNV